MSLVKSDRFFQKVTSKSICGLNTGNKTDEYVS